MIKKITAAIIVIIKTANLINTLITAAFRVINVNNRFNKQFKSKDIRLFNSKLDIEKNIIIINNKL